MLVCFGSLVPAAPSNQPFHRAVRVRTGSSSSTFPMRLLLLLLAFFALLVPLARAKTDDIKAGWTCEKDGFYYENGVKSTWKCDPTSTSKAGDDAKKKTPSSDDAEKTSTGDKATSSSTTTTSDTEKEKEKEKEEETVSSEKVSACTRDSDLDLDSDDSTRRTCIPGPPDGLARCWWTRVPASVTAAPSSVRVPLVLDMHGGGMCPSMQRKNSGWAALSDALSSSSSSPASSFIVAWPAGFNKLWGACGSDCDLAKAATPGKDIADTDDLTFLSNVIAHETRRNGSRVDPTRVYATGFSYGCMMAHRLAMERSAFIAGFGCHGGYLIQPGANLTQQQTRFKIKPTPAHMTGGSDDQWFDTASLDAWAKWNGCDAGNAGNVTTNRTTTTTESTTETQVVLDGGVDEATVTTRGGCAAATRRLEIRGAKHVIDARMAKLTWRFLEPHSRPDALRAISLPPPDVISTTVNGGGGAAKLAASRSATAVAVLMVVVAAVGL